jgi:hypothetical protein
MRYFNLLAVAMALSLTGCIGPAALHQAVLGYDESVGRLERELLLLNIARTHQRLPGHFTVTSSVTATFDYRANLGAFASFLDHVKPPRIWGVNATASVAESPTMTILPVQGEEFNNRILTPLDEKRFLALMFQRIPVDMVMRLIGDGFEIYRSDGTLDRSIVNWPSAADGYREFRRRVMHLARLQANGQLFVGPLVFDETVQATVSGQLSAGEELGAFERGWRPVNQRVYEFTKPIVGRLAVTNYDTRILSNAERVSLNARADANGRNVVFVDIRPESSGGDFAFSGGLRLRSFNVILSFVAAGIEEAPEIDVAPDPRTGPVPPNPRRALAIEVSDFAPSASVPEVAYNGRHYAVADTRWDREAFKVLHQLFQMTVTESAKAGAVPSISISK